MLTNMIIETITHTLSTFFDLLLDIFNPFLFVFSIFVLCRLKLLRSTAEDRTLVFNSSRTASRALSKTSFSFLENVIKGKGFSPSHSQALEAYIKKHKIPNTSAFNQVLLVFHSTNGGFSGSFSDFRKKEKDESETFTLPALDHIKFDYFCQGQERTSIVHIFKIRPKDTEDIIYVPFVELRPLKSLLVLHEKKYYDLDDYLLQMKAYEEELKFLLEKDEACRGRFSMLKYDPKENFSETVEKLVQLNLPKPSQCVLGAGELKNIELGPLPPKTSEHVTCQWETVPQNKMADHTTFQFFIRAVGDSEEEIKNPPF